MHEALIYNSELWWFNAQECLPEALVNLGFSQDKPPLILIPVYGTGLVVRTNKIMYFIIMKQYINAKYSHY